MATPAQQTVDLDKLTISSPLALDTPTSESEYPLLEKHGGELACNADHPESVSPFDTLSPTVNTKARSDSVSALQSSRPAPPSPASSRPPSQLLNHSPSLGPSPATPRDRSGSSSSSRVSSGVMNRRVSATSSRHSEKDKAARRKSTLSQGFSLPVDESESAGPSSQATSTGQNTPSIANNDASLVASPIPEDHVTPSSPMPAKADDPKSPTIPVLTVLIRDYGFPPTDERFFGRGQIAPTPKHKWRLSGFTLGRRASQQASGSGTASDEGSPRSPDPGAESDADRRASWGFGIFGWRGFGARKRSVSSESTPSQATPIHDEPEDTDDVDDQDYFSDEHDESEEPWGMYRAAYAFEAEGEHEMTVAEGEVIEVRGRGGGEGWVIGVKTGQEGLVPEGYLERYIPSRDEDADDGDDSIEELKDEGPK